LSVLSSSGVSIECSHEQQLLSQPLSLPPRLSRRAFGSAAFCSVSRCLRPDSEGFRIRNAIMHFYKVTSGDCEIGYQLVRLDSLNCLRETVQPSRGS
jgi:hypothetical protein